MPKKRPIFEVVVLVVIFFLSLIFYLILRPSNIVQSEFVETFDSDSMANTRYNVAVTDNRYSAFGNMVRLDNGDLVVFYREGENSGEGFITFGDNTSGIYKRLSHENGVTWGDRENVYSDNGVFDDRGPPSVCVTPTGAVVLAFTRVNADTSCFQTLYMRSTDNGNTWSSPKALENLGDWSGGAGWVGGCYGKIIYADGDLLMSAYDEHYVGAVPDNSRIKLYRSHDGGITFDNKNYITIYKGTIPFSEADFTYLGNGKFIGISRVDNNNISFYQFVSSDNAVTWTGYPTMVNYASHGSMGMLYSYEHTGEQMLLFVEGDRQTQRIVFRTADASDVFRNPTRWSQITSTIMTAETNTTEYGYPSSVIFEDNYPSFVTVYNSREGAIGTLPANLYAITDNLEGGDWRRFIPTSNETFTVENGWGVYTDSENNKDNERTFKVLGYHRRLTMKFDFMKTAPDNRISMTFYDNNGMRAGEIGYWSSSWYQDFCIWWENGILKYFPINVIESGAIPIANYSLNTTYHLKLILDAENKKFEVYIDNVLRLSDALDYDTQLHKVNDISYVEFTGNRNVGGNAKLYIDNMRVL
jgi:hypothetical protein